MVAPASAYAASGSQAPSPAPRSTRTSMPLARSLATASGTSATRCSPGAPSLITPAFMRLTISMNATRMVGRGPALLLGMESVVSGDEASWPGSAYAFTAVTGCLPARPDSTEVRNYAVIPHYLLDRRGGCFLCGLWGGCGFRPRDSLVDAQQLSNLLARGDHRAGVQSSRGAAEPLDRARY